MSNSFCVLPWIHLHTRPDGKVFPCCVWDIKSPVGDLKSQTIDEIANSPTMNNVRQRMLDYEVLPECGECNSRCKSTNKFERNLRNTQFSTIIPKLINGTASSGALLSDFTMRVMNIRYSNLCNFTCRTCGPDNSSLWAQENKQVIPVVKVSDSVPRYTDEIFKHLLHVESISFAGGESIFIPEHWEILDKLLELGRTSVEINYTTNLSQLTFKGKNLIDYAKQFPNFRLVGSVDCSHKRAEIYRHGYQLAHRRKELTADPR